MKNKHMNNNKGSFNSFNYLWLGLLIIILVFYFRFSQAVRNQISGDMIDWNLNSFFPIIILIIAVLFLIFLFRSVKYLNNVNSNLKILEELLNTNAKRPFFGLWFYQKIEGVYKNNKILCRVLLIDRPGVAFWAWVLRAQKYIDIFIKVAGSNRDKKNLIPPAMFLCKGYLHYSGDFRYMILVKQYSREEIIAILDELINTTKQLS